jgi:hypothetical protein
VFTKYKEEIVGTLSHMEQLLRKYFALKMQEIKEINSNPITKTQTLFEALSKAKDARALKLHVKQLLAMVTPSIQNNTKLNADLTEAQLTSTIRFNYDELNKTIFSNINEINGKLK